jgi:hypothetical protein
MVVYLLLPRSGYLVVSDPTCGHLLQTPQDETMRSMGLRRDPVDGDARAGRSCRSDRPTTTHARAHPLARAHSFLSLNALRKG